MKIGRHIDLLLAPMSDDKAREWRSHLWFFVSNFTEFDAMKLFKLYRHAVKKENEGGGDREAKEPKEHKDHKEKHKKDKRDKHREKEKENLKKIMLIVPHIMKNTWYFVIECNYASASLSLSTWSS